MGAIVNGQITAYGDYVGGLNDIRYGTAFYDTIRDKIVASSSDSGLVVMQVRDGELDEFSISNALGNSIVTVDADLDTSGAETSPIFTASNIFGDRADDFSRLEQFQEQAEDRFWDGVTGLQARDGNNTLVYTPDGEAVFDLIQNAIHHFEDASGDEVQRDGRPDIATVGDFLSEGVATGIPFEDTFSGSSPYYFPDNQTYTYYNDFGDWIDFDDWFNDWDIIYPVVLDLDGDGVELTSRLTSGVFFDFDLDGYKTRTAWAGRDDGFLVIDLAANGLAGADGLITLGRELSFTAFAPGATSDLAALRQAFDTNHDNILSAADARFNEFRIWKDADQDGVTDAGELKTLAQTGISSVSLLSDNSVIDLPDESRIMGMGSYNKAGGGTGLLADTAMTVDGTGVATSVIGNPAYNHTLVDFERGRDIEIWRTSAYDNGITTPTPQPTDPLAIWINAAFAAGQISRTVNGGNTTIGNFGAFDGYPPVSWNNKFVFFGGAGADSSVADQNIREINFFGGAGIDYVFGTAYDDALSGEAGADVIAGNGGDDTLVFEQQDLYVDGGAGFDTAIAEGSTGVVFDAAARHVEAVYGTGLADTLTNNSTTLVAMLDGQGGNDSITGGGAADDLFGGDGVDSISGGNGGDLMDGGAGADSMWGQGGDDILRGDDDNDTLSGGDGVDTLSGGAGADWLYGEAGNDALNGDNDNDMMIGGAGTDTLNGGGGTDAANYSAETAQVNVTLFLNVGGVAGSLDTLLAIENLIGGSAGDFLNGNNNANWIRGGGGIDNIWGYGGADTLDGEAAADNLYGGDANDALNGGDGADWIYGEAGNDALNGGNDNDVMIGGAGTDTLNGGAGTDTANYSAETAQVDVTMFLNTGGVAGSLDTLLAIEDVIGGTGGDYLNGNDGVNWLRGGGGADHIWSYGGNDRVDGEAGADLLYGGEGVDVMDGGDAGDWIYGENGNDTLNGGLSSGSYDVLVGGAGNDTLNGGVGGFDYFYGGDGSTPTGNDIFIVAANSGTKVINDFEAGGANDAVRLTGTALTNYSQVQANLSWSGAINGMVLVVDSSTQVWFVGVAAGQLTSADFAFA